MQTSKPIIRKPQPIKYDPKKLPRSTKYDHVQGSLKTGSTVRDVEILTDARVAKVKNEIFERISAKKLNQLLAIETANDDPNPNTDENVPHNNQ